MKATRIKFDDTLEVGVFSEYLNKEIWLCILDDLDASIEGFTILTSPKDQDSQESFIVVKNGVGESLIEENYNKQLHD